MKSIKQQPLFVKATLIVMSISIFLLGGYLVAANQTNLVLVMLLIVPAIYVFFHPFLGVLSFVFFIPLESAFLGIGGGAATVTRILGIFIFSAWFVKVLMLRRKIEFYEPVKWAVVLIVWAMLSFIWAWNQEAALQRLQTLIQLFLLLLMITNEIDNVKKLQSVLIALLSSTILAGLLGVFGVGVNQTSRLLTLEGQGAKEYAAYIGIAFLLITIRYFYGDARYRFIHGVLALILLIPLFASGERGIIVALFVAWLSIAAFTHQRVKHSILILLILTTLFVAPVILQRSGLISDWTASRFTFDNIIASGGANRADIWKSGLVLVRENLLWGVGTGNFTSAIGSYIIVTPINSRISLTVDPHGDWLSLLGELGLIGFVLFIVFLGRIFSHFVVLYRLCVNRSTFIPLQLLTIWSLAIYLVSVGLTSTFMYRKIYWLGLAMAIFAPILFKSILEKPNKDL